MAGETEIVFDDEDLQRFLDKINKHFKDPVRLKQVVDSMSIFVFKDVMDHFKRRQGPDGPWAKWSISYAKYMKKIGKGGNLILQDTGRLRDTFKPTHLRTSDNMITWYNNAKTKKRFPYAWHHDEGAEKTRPFMWLSDKAADKMAKSVLELLLEEVESGK